MKTKLSPEGRVFFGLLALLSLIVFILFVAMPLGRRHGPGVVAYVRERIGPKPTPTIVIRVPTRTSVPPATKSAIAVATSTSFVPARTSVTPVVVKTTDTPVLVPPETKTTKQLPVVEVGIVVYAPYSSFIGATYFDQDWGVEIRVVNLTGKEALQCEWVRGEAVEGELEPPGPEVVARLLCTTLDSARFCPECVVPLAIDNSVGADAIVVKGEIKNWNDIFKYKAVGTGCSVSQYFISTLAWAMGEKLSNWIPADDAEPAMNQWLADPNIKTAVLWEPYVSDALQQMPGSWIALSTKSWTGIWDVVVTKRGDFNQAVYGALAAYVQFLNLQMRNQAEAWNVLTDWANQNKESGALGYDNSDEFYGDLALTAQATLRDNIQLFVLDPEVLTQRIKEVNEVMSLYPCLDEDGKPLRLPPLQEPKDMLDRRYIERLRAENSLDTADRPINDRISLSRVAPLEGEVSKEVERVIARSEDVFIEFESDSADFKFPRQAEETIEKIYVRLLRLTKQTILDLTGGYAMPKGCMEMNPTTKQWQPCTDVVGRDLAIRRANKVRDILINLYGIPQERVRLTTDQGGNIVVRQPVHRDTRDVNLMSQDRRVEGRIIFIAGQ